MSQSLQLASPEHPMCRLKAVLTVWIASHFRSQEPQVNYPLGCVLKRFPSHTQIPLTLHSCLLLLMSLFLLMAPSLINQNQSSQAFPTFILSQRRWCNWFSRPTGSFFITSSGSEPDLSFSRLSHRLDFVPYFILCH